MMREVDDNQDRFSSDQLPGYISPTSREIYSPKVTRTVLDTAGDTRQLPDNSRERRQRLSDRDAMEERRLERAWKQNEANKAAFLGINRRVKAAQNHQTLTRESTPVPKSAKPKLSRIPLPNINYQRYSQTTSSRANQEKPAAPVYKQSRIPVLVRSSRTKQETSQRKPPIVSRESVSVSLNPVPTSRIPVPISRRQVPSSRVREDTPVVPMVQSRIPVADTRRSKLTKSSRPKQSLMKRAKKAVIDKFRSISPPSNFPSMDKFFKRLRENFGTSLSFDDETI